MPKTAAVQSEVTEQDVVGEENTDNVTTATAEVTRVRPLVSSKKTSSRA